MLELTKLKLTYKILTLSSPVLPSLLTGLEKEHVRYNFMQTTIKRDVAQKGSDVIFFNSVFHGSLPTMVFAGFVDNRIIEGELQSNPFVYGSHNVVSFQYLKNGTPFRTYEPDYDNDDFLDVYFAFLNAIGCGKGDIDVGLTVSSHVSRVDEKN